MNQSIQNQLIQNLERENKLLEKRCSTLEKAVQKANWLFWNKMRLFTNSRTFATNNKSLLMT